MKSGVFGDSFAAQDQKNIWWQYLQTKHGHQVDSFGSAGSSMLYSAILTKKHQRMTLISGALLHLVGIAYR